MYVGGKYCMYSTCYRSGQVLSAARQPPADSRSEGWVPMLLPTYKVCRYQLCNVQVGRRGWCTDGTRERQMADFCQAGSQACVRCGLQPLKNCNVWSLHQPHISDATAPLAEASSGRPGFLPGPSSIYYCICIYIYNTYIHT